MHRQFIWKLLAAHLGVAVSAFGMHRQFIQKLLAVQLGVAVSSFGMYRQFIWKSWAPKMGSGKMLVLRGKMFGPWTAEGILRGCSF